LSSNRRQHIAEALALLDKRIQHLGAVQTMLKDEPRARVRRLRSDAFICPDDVAVFSGLLKQEFPDLAYFFSNYKTRWPRPPKFPDDVPIVLHDSLEVAVKEALRCEREEGLNRPDIFIRWPWPDELASGDPEQLIGRREFPDGVFDLAIQYRDVGRWFTFHYGSHCYLDPRSPEGDRRLDLSLRSRMPLDQYPDFEILDAAPSEFFALYDLNDSETMAFAKRAHALWRRTITKDVALYDPVTRAIAEFDVEKWTRALPMEPGPLSRALGTTPLFAAQNGPPDARKWKHHTSVGKRALAGALAMPPRYAAFAFSSFKGKTDGPALTIGPRPTARKRSA
jgi:hypothetical protein